ncbi:MAG: M3 family metallopeptidase [Paracoccaceae bacterium]
MTNPLLSAWDTPHAMPPFDRIEDAHFAPAVDAALGRARAAVAAIADSAEAPTFDNTVVALQRADADLSRILGAFYALAGADATPAREALMREFSPKLAAYASDVTGNRALFARIEAVAESPGPLDAQDARLLELTHRDFVRAGAALEGQAATRLREIKSRLATLGTQFTQNLLADERAWSMDLTEATLATLPPFLADATRAAGAERGTGPVVTLSRSVIDPFLRLCPDRDLRERAFRAWEARGAQGGDTDTRAIAAETLALRYERAQLLGYPDYASWKLQTEMAGDAASVRDLLMRVWRPARAAALRDAETYQALLRDDHPGASLQPWDWRYYAEAVRARDHDLDEAQVKPFLSLDGMREAAFDCATKLFGLEFAPADLPLYHPDARAWEVSRDGRHLAVFVTDYFARASKRSGAWCSAMRSQSALDGDVRPIVVNVCNFAKPSTGPALLSYDDARTLFHEFGHALHQMLSDVRYERFSGTSVARDFVELPSQLYEHWLEVPEVLRAHARHAETGEAMPDALLDRVLGAATHDMGFQTVEYLASALVDLDFHDGPPPVDPMQRQAEVLDALGMPDAIRMRHATPQFAHVFAGDGYAAGYYSYMWSEVMDADAFDSFREASGPFDAERATALEKHVLSAGGSRDAADLYLAFRGRMPGPEALLRGRGLAEAAA